MAKTKPDQHVYKPGDKAGKWTIVTALPAKGSSCCYKCRCACGKVTVILVGNLRAGKTTQCKECCTAKQCKASKYQVGGIFHNRKIISRLPRCRFVVKCLKCRKTGPVMQKQLQFGCMCSAPQLDAVPITVKVDGKPLTLTLAEWWKRASISKQAYYCRLSRGWSQEKALTTIKPPGMGPKSRRT